MRIETIMDTKDYPRVKHQLQVINLSNHVLSLGLNFSPTSNYDPFTAIKVVQLFAQKCLLKKLHWTDEDLRAIEILEELELEGMNEHSGNKQMSLNPSPRKFPPLNP